MLIVRGKWRRRVIGFAGLLTFCALAGAMTSSAAWNQRYPGLAVGPMAPAMDGLEERRYDLRGFFVNAASGCFPDEQRPTTPFAKELGDALCKLIIDTVDSDSWQVCGGKASARWENGYLVVHQTPENHRQLDRLFEQLLETRMIHSVEWITADLRAR